MSLIDYFKWGRKVDGIKSRRREEENRKEEKRDKLMIWWQRELIGRKGKSTENVKEIEKERGVAT